MSSEWETLMEMVRVLKKRDRDLTDENERLRQELVSANATARAMEENYHSALARIHQLLNIPPAKDYEL